jgi:hypothetical protein
MRDEAIEEISLPAVRSFCTCSFAISRPRIILLSLNLQGFRSACERSQIWLCSVQRFFRRILDICHVAPCMQKLIFCVGSFGISRPRIVLLT